MYIQDGALAQMRFKVTAEGWKESNYLISGRRGFHNVGAATRKPLAQQESV
jgi:hypothetical protein